MADQPNAFEKHLLSMLHDFVERQYLEAVNDFRTNPGGGNWTRLEDIMWAWQGVNSGGLPKSTLLTIVNTKPVTIWIAELTKLQKGDD